MRNSSLKRNVRRKPSNIAIGVGLLVIAALAGIGSVPRADAQETVRLRGTIDRLDGPMYVVKSRDGAEFKVRAADNATITGVMKASLSDIKPGSFVGVAAMPQADGSQIALEVHIFPESMRGSGEGHYPWDLRPQSTMTNATVETQVSSVEGQTLTLRYKDGEKKIFVPANTEIVAYIPGERSELKPGAKVFIGTVKQPDGTFEGRVWRVGRDGVTPPL
jgi:outer membrane lipoprotein SlyB